LIREIGDAGRFPQKGDGTLAVEMLMDVELVQCFTDRRRIAHELPDDAQVGQVPYATRQEAEMRAACTCRGLVENPTQRDVGDSSIGIIEGCR